MEDPTRENWMTVPDVAELFVVNEETVRRWIRRGHLPVLNLGKGRGEYRIRRADLATFVHARYGKLLGKTPGPAETEEPSTN